MKPFSLLIKPSSGDCNLSCEYCFYVNKGLYPEDKVHRMSKNVLEKLVQSYCSIEQTQYIFAWQGGEPSIMGLDFFKKVTDLQIKHAKPGSVISNGFQTNATLIDDNFAKHFAKYNFLVGVSLDGPPDIHNKYRKDKNNNGTFESVMKGIKCLQENKVEFNILILVNSFNVSEAKRVYGFLSENNFFYQQYIPCVEFDEHSKLQSFSITGQQWGKFLIDLFNEWLNDDTDRVYIRNFYEILHVLLHREPSVCYMQHNCCQYFVVEYNGDVYPCDFFVGNKYKLGNIMTDSWEKILQSSTYKKFGNQKSMWNIKCKTCEFLSFCAGDCLKFRLYDNNSNPQQLSWLCEGWSMFYKYALPKFRHKYMV